MEGIALDEPAKPVPMDMDRDAIMTAKLEDSKTVKKRKGKKRGNRRTLVY